MVYYCGDAKLDVPRDLKGQYYHLRLTKTQEELIEKILILEQGMDDRVIAMIKPYIVGDMVLKGAIEDTKMYFHRVDRGIFSLKASAGGENCG